MEACLTVRLTLGKAGPKVQGFSFARCVVSLDKELYSALSVFTQLYNCVPGILRWV